MIVGVSGGIVCALVTDAAEVIKDMFAAYGRWDVERLGALLDVNVTYWFPGRSPMAGEIHGRDAVIDLLERQRAYLGGKSYTVTPERMVADGDHVLFMATATAVTPTAVVSWRAINAYVVRQGAVAECRVYVHDLYAFDAFWDGIERR